jgi:hypothetical protein
MRTAADICRPIRLGRKARTLLQDGQKPVAYLRLLVEHAQYVDALRLLAHGMLPRPAVWWGCLCARHAGGEDLPEPERAALFAAVAWVLLPNSANREAARTAAQAATLRTPAGCVAQAAYWSGTTAAPDRPVTPVNAELAAKLVATGVLLGAARSKAAERNWTYRQYIALGIDVDCGLNSWIEKGPGKPG